LIEENYTSSSGKYNVDDEGSENAPEDSGFVSDDGEDQERIVNESSLDAGEEDMYVQVGEEKFFTQECEEEMMLIMTGRSETALDDAFDDEIEGISKCKAINTSFINFKRNNLLNAYGKR
jgi:hypothetical protein